MTLGEKNIIEYIENATIIISKYEKNESLHLEGDNCIYLEIILKGSISVERIDENGNILKIAVFNTGDLIGANLVFSENATYPISTRCNEITYIAKIKKNELNKILISNQAFLSKFLEKSSRNSKILVNKIKNFMSKSLRDMIISYLNNKSIEQNSKVINLDMSKTQIAHLFGVQRTSLSRELKKMKDEGLIDYDNNTITIIVD